LIDHQPSGAVSLARDTNMTVSKAKVFIERFFEKFPSLGRWVSAVRKQANKYPHSLLDIGWT